MLHSSDVVQTNDITQALNQTIQVQPFGALLGIQLHTVRGLSWRLREGPCASQRPLWRRLASGKHALTAAPTTPETFDESCDWRAGRKARTRQCFGTKKADVPALKALDRYTVLGTHDQTTCLDRSFTSGPHLSDISLSSFGVTIIEPIPLAPAFRLTGPVSPAGLLLCGDFGRISGPHVSVHSLTPRSVGRTAAAATTTAAATAASTATWAMSGLSLLSPRRRVSDRGRPPNIS